MQKPGTLDHKTLEHWTIKPRNIRMRVPPPLQTPIEYLKLSTPQYGNTWEATMVNMLNTGIELVSPLSLSSNHTCKLL